MEFYSFNKESGKQITQFNSNFVMSRIIQTDVAAHIGCMHLDKNGIVGHHQAVVPQLLLVVDGEGHVRGEKGGYVKVRPGDAVFWAKDEWHETKSETGMTAIVIESGVLDPSAFMTLKEIDMILETKYIE